MCKVMGRIFFIFLVFHLFLFLSLSERTRCRIRGDGKIAHKSLADALCIGYVSGFPDNESRSRHSSTLANNSLESIEDSGKYGRELGPSLPSPARRAASSSIVNSYPRTALFARAREKKRWSAPKIPSAVENLRRWTKTAETEVEQRSNLCRIFASSSAV